MSMPAAKSPVMLLQASGLKLGLPQQRPCTRQGRQMIAAPVNALACSSGLGAAAATSTSGRDSEACSAAAPAFGACLPASGSISSSMLGRAGEQAWLCTATGGGDGGSGAGGSGGGAGGSGGNGDADDSSEDENEEYLDLTQAEEMAAAKGVSLPEDFAAAAAAGGLKRSVLEAYARLASGGFITAWLVKAVPAFRNRLIRDRLFFFKVWAEVAIDSGCATVAELRKRGDEFWSEFEFYLSDLLVGLVLDVVLVTLIAPVARPGRPARESVSGLKRLLNRLPSAVFEKSMPGCKFAVGDRVATYVKLGLEYSLAGIVCGFIGQGIANSMMLLKRRYAGPSEHDVAVPPLVRTALVWGLFMGVSSNTRYQVVFGLERIVDETIARRIPQAAYFTTLAIRFANNVVGGENFIDMARWAGVQ
ncbi:hypothetical protein ABPG75_004184 [Micractinium tetrahymenae]